MRYHYDYVKNFSTEDKPQKVYACIIMKDLEEATDTIINKLYPNYDEVVIRASEFKEVLNKQQLYMYALLNKSSVSEIVKGDKPEGLNMLSPFGMYFFKKKYNINYEQWDKEDSALSKMMPHRLYTYLMSDSTVFDPNDILEIRQSLDEPFDKYPKKSIKDYTESVVRQYDPGRHIELQTYLAHVSNRNKYMILDKTNWDLMPKALDAQLVKEEVTTLSSLPW